MLVKQFEPTFEASDLLQLNNRHFIISMIIGGEKVPAFSATTLSIPDSPADNFDAIVEASRSAYGRPRAEIEAEIRETIEQSEKYKKELSDSGREAGSQPVFAPISRHSSAPVSVSDVRGNYGGYTEQKPNLKYVPTPQEDLRKSGLSPNTAEGKERLGLKDLAKLVAENQPLENQTTENRSSKKHNRRQKGKHKNASTPVTTSVKSDRSAAKTPGNSPVSSPVKVEYQEKSPAQIATSDKQIDLNVSIRDPENFAKKDNSVDGFLSIRH